MASHTFLVQEKTSILEITLGPSIHNFMSKMTFSLTISLKKCREERMESKLDFDNVKN